MRDHMELLEEVVRGLNDEQYMAVTRPERYIRVLAGAGAGKTETIVRRIIWLMTNYHIKPEEIVAITFTEKAAEEMKLRVIRRLEELGLRELAYEAGNMFVGTIHSFCLDLLERYYQMGEYHLLDDKQEFAFVLKHGWDLGIEMENYPSNCGKFLKSVNVVYDSLVDRKALEGQAPDFYQKLVKYEELLEKYRLLTFSRVVYVALERLKESCIVGNLKHIIVDEFQDVNPAQEELVKILGRQGAVFVVGDPRQTIYQWRGSDAECFERFLSHFQAKDIRVAENRRSVPVIVECANGFSKSFEKTINEPMRPVRKEKGAVYYLHFQDKVKEAEWIAKQIEHLKTLGFNYSDMAVLYRSVMGMAQPLIEELEKREIPYVVLGSTGLFERKEAMALRCFFSWLYEGGYIRIDRKCLEGDEILQEGIKLWKEATGLEVLEESIRKWKDCISKNEYAGFLDAYHKLLALLGVKELDYKKHSVIMASLGRFSELLLDFESVHRLSGGWNGLASNLGNFFFYLNSYAVDSYEEIKPESYAEVDAVSIATVHQSKGLEWSAVFLPSLIEGAFPSSKVDREQDWQIPRELFDADRYEGELEDERRLFYVAITRAKDYLVLSSYGKNPSRFIENIKGHYTQMDWRENLQLEPIANSSRHAEASFTVSELMDYHRCPTLFMFRQHYRHKAQINDMLFYGKSLHYCLRLISERLKTEGITQDKLQEVVNQVVEKHFHMPYISRDNLHRLTEKAKKVLYGRVLKDFERLKSSSTHEFRLALEAEDKGVRVLLNGRADLVQEEEGKVRVVEYKTSDEVTTPEYSKFQLALYCIALEGMGKRVSSACVAYLDEESKDIEFSFEQGELEDYSRRVQEVIRGIVSESFTPESPEYCPHCDYVKICKHCRVC